MSDLADFLLARIADNNKADIEAHLAAGDEFPYPWQQMLAECEAKRRIVREAAAELTGRDIEGAQSDGDDGPWMADRVLRLLALPYADHPDYREEWKP